MRVLKVRDLMSDYVVMLSPETTLRQAAETLANMGISGAPVCGPNAKPIGVFSKSDVVDRLSSADVYPTTPVEQCMTPVAFSVRPDDAIDTAVKLMAEERVHRLVVVDDSGQVAGIISPMDVMRAVHEGRLRLAPGDAT